MNDNTGNLYAPKEESPEIEQQLNNRILKLWPLQHWSHQEKTNLLHKLAQIPQGKQRFLAEFEIRKKY